jgi:hypothetical protein
MYLTGHELTAASSAVAALAIVGGYFGVRSANHNALKIAREERSSRQRDEFNALKRVTYAKILTALAALASASLEQESIVANPEIRGPSRIAVITKRAEALTTARNTAAELGLIASDVLRNLADESLEYASTCTRMSATTFVEGSTRLRLAMRFDLQDIEIPSRAELDRMALQAIASERNDPQSGYSDVPTLPARAADNSESSTFPA